MKNKIIFVLIGLVYFNLNIIGQTIHLKKTIIVNNNGTISFYDKNYNKEDIKVLLSILKTADLLFNESLNKKNNDNCENYIGKTKYHSFVFYSNYSKQKSYIYSHILIWDITQTYIVGIICKEYNITQELIKQPFQKILKK